MLRTHRPARIYERVVETLLNVVNNALFEIGWIISEHSDPSDRLLHGRFLIAPDSLGEIMPKEPKHAVRLNLGNWALLFTVSPDDIARRAVCHAVAIHDVACAEDLMAHDTGTAPVVGRE